MTNWLNILKSHSPYSWSMLTEGHHLPAVRQLLAQSGFPSLSGLTPHAPCSMSTLMDKTTDLNPVTSLQTSETSGAVQVFPEGLVIPVSLLSSREDLKIWTDRSVKCWIHLERSTVPW